MHPSPSPVLEFSSARLTSLYCGSASDVQAAVTVEGREKPFNIFQKVTIRKTRCANILEKSVLEKLGCSCLDSGASSLGIIKIWNISKSMATKQSAWYSRMATWGRNECVSNEPQRTSAGRLTSNRHENVYFPDSIERATSTREMLNELPKPARETHAPMERLGSKRNQYGDGLLTRQSTCIVNWI